ncbi:MAG: hypothetical protein ABSH04_05865 [Acidimicrobiales bacterium]|jgi:hypothetical protein
MSDVPQGSGWWLASDGKWYAPHLHPFAAPAPVAGTIKAPRLWPGIVLLSVGCTCAIAGFVLFIVIGFAGLIGSRTYNVPAVVTVTCHTGDYYVYQHTGSQVSAPGFSYSNSGFPTLRPNNVIVIDPDGEHVSTWSGDGSETITKGSWIYSNAVGFHASDPGEYRVQITGISSSSVIVAPSLGSEFLRAAAWLILVGVGALIVVVGGVLLIVALVRRSRAKKHAFYGWPYPPGSHLAQTSPPHS